MPPQLRHNDRLISTAPARACSRQEAPGARTVLVFFLHITTGPDNTNNALALAFGALIVGLVIAGSVWIMFHLNANMSLPPGMMDLRMQK